MQKQIVFIALASTMPTAIIANNATLLTNEYRGNMQDQSGNICEPNPPSCYCYGEYKAKLIDGTCLSFIGCCNPDGRWCNPGVNHCFTGATGRGQYRCSEGTRFCPQWDVIFPEATDAATKDLQCGNWCHAVEAYDAMSGHIDFDACKNACINAGLFKNHLQHTLQEPDGTKRQADLSACAAYFDNDDYNNGYEAATQTTGLIHDIKQKLKDTQLQVDDIDAALEYLATDSEATVIDLTNLVARCQTQSGKK